MRLGLWTGCLRHPLNCEATILKQKWIEGERIRTPALLSRGDLSTTSHEQISQELMYLLRQVLLGDWPAITSDTLAEIAHRLREIKATYILTHLAHQLPLQEEIIGPLDISLLLTS